IIASAWNDLPERTPPVINVFMSPPRTCASRPPAYRHHNGGDNHDDYHGAGYPRSQTSRIIAGWRRGAVSLGAVRRRIIRIGVCRGFCLEIGRLFRTEIPTFVAAFDDRAIAGAQAAGRPFAVVARVEVVPGRLIGRVLALRFFGFLVDLTDK